ncbi:alpha/beta hydrolase family esterase [Sinimarinibacterium sp. CAU 1509]|uniref:alpha/beta hydrolase family esterase n=1 Tax=Sinimarinibacterium sp. CAU 1509 TaxID=2562283 RepID=UPI0024A98627|nr:PHB depolymerase family esterase [Sinimarinibacterium sp. CAU 1509]
MRSSTLSTADGVRSYRIFIPPGYSAQRPMPLVVALHGGLGSGEIMAEQTGFNRVAEARGFLVAYPDGIGRTWNAGRCCGPAMEKRIDDVGFVRAVIAQVRRDYAVDTAHIFGTGFSNGAMLLHRIACEAPDTFSAIAPVSGGIMLSPCAARSGVSALLIQGRDDPRIPWNGGVFDDSYRPSMADVVNSLAQRNGCGAGEQVIEQKGAVSCSARSSCRETLQWCGLAGVGHQWPGGATYLPRLLGQNTATWDASRAIGQFFGTQIARSATPAAR